MPLLWMLPLLSAFSASNGNQTIEAMKYIEERLRNTARSFIHLNVYVVGQR